jgi:ABC-type nitrate/sulfonate/bicarbonate transport system substrate-binding protein
MSGPPRRLLLAALAGAALLAGTVAAQAADKVTLRTSWLFYGSHSIFLLGIDKGFYAKEGLDLTVKQGNAVRLVANGATISEWIGGDAGLGYYIQIATGDLRMDLAFAIIVVLALLGLALFGSVVLVERLLIPWHISQRAPPQGRTAP